MVDELAAGWFVDLDVEVDGAMGTGAREAVPRPSLAAASLAKAPLYAGRGRGRLLGAAGATVAGAPTAVVVGTVSLGNADAGAAPERADEMSAGFNVMGAAT